MPDALVERDGPVMTITMNRPKRFNALTGEMLIIMHDAMVEASESTEIRCIILTGAEGNFCSGADLKAMAGDVDGTDDLDVSDRMKNDIGFIYRGLLKTDRPNKPIIAAVEGVAIAGGTEILQGTDIRVAGESARFGVSEARWGLYPLGGSAVRLPRQIPYTLAMDVLLTGRHLRAEEALRVGLIGHVVPDGEALPKALEIARSIAANGPLAVQAMLRTIRETEGMPENEAFEIDARNGMAVFRSADAKEGPKAFMEKRPPRFEGR